MFHSSAPGCLVNSNFYPEGHRLPRNETNPCEICFCIGGTKRCTPKKCAPMIRNCRPIVPDGQCCPSSYDCSKYSLQTLARIIICVFNLIIDGFANRFSGFRSIIDHKPKVPTAREFAPRQLDFFSLFFSDESKENSTASWDYETETESLPTEYESSSSGGKDILDAIKESLNYVDVTNKKNATEDQTHLLDSSTQNASSFPYLSNSDADDEDEDDDEDISIFDYFLNGDKTSSTTTESQIGFNVTGKPLANGFTNSPMHIEPVIPDMKNESVKFAMLPMSLYNMINDDGVLMFDKSVSTERGSLIETTERVVPKTTQTAASSKQPERVTMPKEPTTLKNGLPTKTIPPTITKMATTTPSTTTTTTTRQSDTKATIPSKLLPAATTNKAAPVIRPSTVEAVRLKSTVSPSSQKISQATTQKPVSSTSKAVTNAKATKSPAKIPTTSSEPSPTVAAKTTEKPVPSSTAQTATTSHAPPSVSITSMPKLITKKKSSVKNSTSVHQLLTTKTTRIPSTTPKIITIPLNSNAANAEPDMNYDYSDPTLPPSLPNLKIIPFLPTDAVRNSINKGDGYQAESTYYVQPNAHQHPVESHVDTSYSPFNVKPDRENLPYYNSGVADDRIDYDSYKPSSENIVNANYPNIYHPPVSHAPVSINVHVNSKLDYQHGPSKVSAATSTANRNLTVKPPLPPFEPEHLYNIPQPIQLHPDNDYVQYHVNGADSTNEAPVYPSEHNYEIPQFVAIPPMKETSRPASQSSFSYKNKFSPPVQTEGR